MTTRTTDDLERQLQRLAYRSGGGITISPIRDVLSGHTLSPCGEGVFHKVSRIDGTPWVVKEGRWHLSVPIPMQSWLIPGWLLHGPLRAFGSGCLPTEREIRRQYDMYQTVARYVGCFMGDDHVPDGYPDGDDLSNEQRLIRERLPQTIADMEAFYQRRFPVVLSEVLSGQTRWHNFLPREYLLFGKPISGGRRETSYLFQEFINGIPSHDARRGELPRDIRNQLLLLAYLILLLRKETGFVPDTRPRHLFRPSSDWLLDTDNILIGPRGVKIIDTRWFWEADGNIVRRGLGLAELSIQACLGWIETLGK